MGRKLGASESRTRKRPSPGSYNADHDASASQNSTRTTADLVPWLDDSRFWMGTADVHRLSSLSASATWGLEMVRSPFDLRCLVLSRLEFLDDCSSCETSLAWQVSWTCEQLKNEYRAPSALLSHVRSTSLSAPVLSALSGIQYMLPDPLAPLA